jgi:hypothetical protein
LVLKRAVSSVWCDELSSWSLRQFVATWNRPRNRPIQTWHTAMVVVVVDQWWWRRDFLRLVAAKKGPPLHAVGCTRNKRRVDGMDPCKLLLVVVVVVMVVQTWRCIIIHHGKKWLRRRRLDASRCVTINAWLGSTRFHPLHHGETAIQPSSTASDPSSVRVYVSVRRREIAAETTDVH